MGLEKGFSDRMRIPQSARREKTTKRNCEDKNISNTVERKLVSLG